MNYRKNTTYTYHMIYIIINYIDLYDMYICIYIMTIYTLYNHMLHIQYLYIPTLHNIIHSKAKYGVRIKTLR